jgi:hypothetical protein
MMTDIRRENKTERDDGGMREEGVREQEDAENPPI